MLLVAQNERKRKPEVISEGSSVDNHQSEDSIPGHFTRKLFFVMAFMLGQISTIRVRNYICTILAAEVEINIGTKEK